MKETTKKERRFAVPFLAEAREIPAFAGMTNCYWKKK